MSNLTVMFEAKPSHNLWTAVIVVMSFGFWVAANLTWLPGDSMIAQGICNPLMTPIATGTAFTASALVNLL